MKHRLTRIALAALIMAAATWPARVTAADSAPKVTADQLQARIMAFADTYMNVLSEEYARLSALGLTPQQRLLVHDRLLLSTSAAVAIASGPDVVQALLDMLTMVTLSRMVVEEPWVEKEAGIDMSTTRAIAADFEKRIWSIAADVATEEETRLVRAFIDDYRRRHPDQREASFVRFDEGAALRGKTSLTEKVREGGLLSSLSGAGQSIDEARLTGERALFIVNRMPLLVRWQVENLLYQLALSPEYQKLSATPESLETSVDRLSASLEVIPGLVTSERKAVLAALDDKNGALNGTVADLRGALSEAISALPQVQILAATAERTVSSGRETSMALDQLLATSGRLMDRVEKDGERFDRYLAVIPELGAVATTLQGVAGSLERVLGKNLDVAAVMDGIFWRMVMLIIVFFAAMLAAGVLYKIATRQWAGGARAGYPPHPPAV